MPPPADRFAYVAVIGKPRNMISNGICNIDASCCLLLYSGNLNDIDLARAVTPLAAGEVVTFPGNCRGVSWRGLVGPLHVTKQMRTHC